ncbi:MAG: putative transcriptional regulator [Candidatus Omnitrophota bacterium]|jgi:predicted transcriptional regulator
MTRNVITVKKTQVITDVIKIMADKKIGCTVVVDDDSQVNGIITRHVIIKMLAELGHKE